MKTTSFRLLTAGLLATAAPAFALEAPADLAPPPPASPAKEGKTHKLPEFKLRDQAQAKPAAPKSEAPFLGVITGEVPDMLSEHIGLARHEGVIVRSVVPQGPAAGAGIALNDVITKVSGSPVGTPAELSKLVSARKPGESVTLDLIQKGKPSTVAVRLGFRPAELLTAELPGQFDLESMPKELADRVRDAIAGNVQGMNFQQGAELEQLPNEMRNAIEEMQKRMQGAIGGAGGIVPMHNGQQTVQGEATVRMSDNQGSVEVKSRNGAKEVIVRDHQDNVVWSGPWDTAQDKEAAPGSIRQRVDNLNLDTSFEGPGIRLRMGGGNNR